ncbi:pathogenicity-like protein, partial [Xanthomonas hortorum pv. vitians]|nr:pathogenicity-like protein [Xanthomonas hortorum pv. vitians]
WRIRLVLLLVIGAVAMFVVLRHRNAPAPATQPASQQAAPANAAPPAAEDEEVRVRIQPAR